MALNFKILLLPTVLITIAAVQPLAYADVSTVPNAANASAQPPVQNIDGILVVTDKLPKLQEIKPDPSKMKSLAAEANKKNHESLYDKGKKAVENSTISVDILNQKQKILDAFQLGVNERVQLSPAYIGGDFLREDSFIPSESFSPFHWFLRDDYPLDITLDSKQEIDFWRVFKTYHDATHTRKIPFIDFVANDLPVNSHILLHDLVPGTTVRFHVPLNLFTGASYYLPIGTAAFLHSSVGKIYSGEYDVYVFRGQNDMARIRLVAKRTRDWQQIYQAGLSDVGMSQYFPNHIAENIVFAILKLNDIWRKQIDLKDRSDDFLADYSLNLKYPEVRKAYNNLFGKALIFKNKRLNTLMWKIANPLNSVRKIKTVLINDLTGIEKLCRKDLTKPFHDQRVQRNFIGSDSTTGSEDQGHIGLGALFKISNDTSYRVNKMTVDHFTKDGNLDRKYYIFPQWYVHHSSAKFFNIFREDVMRAADMIYRADSKFTPTDFYMMGFYYDIRESRYGNPANQKVIRHFHNVLPPAIFSDLKSFMAQNNLLHLPKILRGVRVSGRYFLNEHGLESVEHHFYGASPGQVFNSILYDVATVVRSSRQLTAWPRLALPSARQKCIGVMAIDPKLWPGDPVLRYCGDLVYITKHLTSILNLSLSPRARMAAVTQLLKDNLFREIGPALIFSVIPKSAYKKALYVEIKFYLPKHIPPISYYWPRTTDGKPIVNVDLNLIEQMLDNTRMFNNETPDMRLNCDHDSVTCRRTRFDGSIQHGENNDPMAPF